MYAETIPFKLVDGQWSDIVFWQTPNLHWLWNHHKQTKMSVTQ